MAVDAPSTSGQPVPTLYVSNLETKTKKQELRQQLYALFMSFGKVIDVVALKGGGMRGQAFIVYAEQASATSALKGLDGEEFYGKPLRIAYARTTSLATQRLTDPEAATASLEASKKKAAKLVVSRAQEEFAELERERADDEEGRGKRGHDGEDGEEGGDARAKRRKVDGDDGDDEEMEMDEDDEDDARQAPANGAAATNAPAPPGPKVPTVLLATSLPPEATEEALTTLFAQYPGFQSLQLLPTQSTPTRSASAVFASQQQAAVAHKALDGFLLKPGSPMGVVIVPQNAL